MRKQLIFLSFIFATVSGWSQSSSFYKFEVGGNLGVSNYLGDIGGKEKTAQPFVWDMKLRETRWALGGFARYKISNYFSARVDLMYGRIQGADSLSSNPGRVGRNLSFRNDMLELSARGEVYLYNTNDVGGKGWYRVDFKSYVFAGIGGLLHGPKTLYQGEWVKLRPLMTEGVKYGKVTAVIPVGMGFYFTYKRKHRFGWEAGWRLTFTDYLDDISGVYADPSTFNGNPTALALNNRWGETSNPNKPDYRNYLPGSKRGDSNQNDTYFYTTFSYSYVFRGKNPFYSQHYSWLGGRKGRRTNARVKF